MRKTFAGLLSASLLLAFALPATASSHLSFSQDNYSTYDPETGEGDHPEDLVAADVDGDEDLDLATANNSGDVSVLTNDGGGSFSLKGTHTAGNTSVGIAATDCNGDGDPDLVASNMFTDDVTVLAGTTGADFTKVGDFTAGDKPVSVAAGDVSGDGKTDLVTVNQQAGTVSVLRGNGDCTFQAPRAYTLAGDELGLGPRPTAVATGHLTPHVDDFEDVVVANCGKFSHDVQVFLGTADGLEPAGAYPSGLPHADFRHGCPSDVVLENIDPDPDAGLPDTPLDILTSNAHSDDVSVLRGSHTGAFAPMGHYPTGEVKEAQVPDPMDTGPFKRTQPSGVTSADFDGDGLVDVAASNHYTQNLTVLPGAGGALNWALRQTFDLGSNPNDIVAADLDGDGKPDLAAPTAADSVSVLLNRTSSALGTSRTLDTMPETTE